MFTDHRKKTNKAVVFNCRPLCYIYKCKDHRSDLPTVWETGILQTHIEEFS